MNRFPTMLAWVLMLFAFIGGLVNWHASSQAGQAAERYAAADQASQVSIEDLKRANALAGEYVRSGRSNDVERSKKTSDEGAAKLEMIQNTTEEDGPVQAACRGAQQSYELACAQILLAIQAKQQSKTERGMQFLASKSYLDAYGDFVNEAKTISNDAAADAGSYRKRSSQSAGTAGVCALLVALLAVRQLAFRQIERKRALTRVS